MAELVWDDSQFFAALQRGASRGALVAAHIVHAEAIRLITQTPKTGRVYRRRGTLHQASAPGEPPASDSGRLAQSGRATKGNEPANAFVTFGTVYARALELGSAYQITSGGGEEGLLGQLEFGTQSLAPRPFLRPALANKKDEIIAAIVSEAQAEVLGSGVIRIS